MHAMQLWKRKEFFTNSHIIRRKCNTSLSDISAVLCVPFPVLLCWTCNNVLHRGFSVTYFICDFNQSPPDMGGERLGQSVVKRVIEKMFFFQRPVHYYSPDQA